VTIEFLTPEGAALGVLVALPLAAMAAAGRRAERARALLGLEGPGSGGAGPGLALLACAALLAAAAAQPVLIEREDVRARTDVEALVVVDSSRSMLAAAGPGDEARFDRAREAARRLVEAMPDVPVGLASMTDRVLPHAFPTSRPPVFLATLDRALGVEQPPPAESEPRATSLAALGAVAEGELFSPDAERRLMLVLTDGESRPFAGSDLSATLADAGIETILVQISEPGERVFGPDGEPEPGYVPDPASADVLAALGSQLGGAFGEDQLDEAIQAARDYVGSGPVESVGREVGATQLAPWAVLAALIPLGFLIWRRNVPETSRIPGRASTPPGDPVESEGRAT
jgi:von Willebrand factor type A domain